MKFFNLLFALCLAGSSLAAEYYETITPPAGRIIGNPDPTGTYNIKLLTFGNDKMLAKRNDFNGYCGTSTLVHNVPTSSVWIFSWTTNGQVITATYTDHYSVPTTEYMPWCVGGAPPARTKRQQPESYCGTTTNAYEVTRTSAAESTYESDGVDVVSPYTTTTVFTTTKTAKYCVGGAPESAIEKRSPGGNENGYGIVASLGGSVYDDDSSLTDNCDTNQIFRISGGLLIGQNNYIGYVGTEGQFMFADSLPEYHTLYSVGWSLTDDNFLAIGDRTTFYACPTDSSGYNLFYWKSLDTCIQVMVKVYNADCN
ncbi:unnamed protein product [Ambrosiozyma monospora]|uniref:Unnamed protein product n=1 Tax=Ambrosiozyma monospora TaxID=43982 RepID=A0ACB5SQY4_AMBMO|nr:unnamed protein product [Ambrosiozyma monospora]